MGVSAWPGWKQAEAQYTLFLSTFVPCGQLFDSNLSPVKIQINSTVRGGGGRIWNLRETEASSMKITSYKNENP